MYEARGADGMRQHTVAEIADTVGLHRTTVYEYLTPWKLSAWARPPPSL